MSITAAQAAAELQQLAVAIHDMMVNRMMAYSGFSLMVFDWFLTLPDEITLIWGARWTAVKTAYMINRYLIPVLLSFEIYVWSGYATLITLGFCRNVFAAQSFIIVAFYANVHWMVSLRAWLLWERRSSIGFTIIAVFLLYLLATCLIMGKELGPIRRTAQVIPEMNVCFAEVPSKLWTVWLPSILYEVFIVIITITKAFKHSKNIIHSPVLETLYRDGFLYFVFINLSSVMNLLVWGVAPQGYFLLAIFFTTALCQVVGSRMVMDLRSAGQAKPVEVVYGSAFHRHPVARVVAYKTSEVTDDRGFFEMNTFSRENDGY
ncbi:hypothetical protein SISNIDRAFT_451674 [Sistotremastrum niveocremeum HHB9708]|uniref:DUF6533 domain-containing protein n=2 Tax=Sistotremastraceae TaxID=3402574 RepID=A0A164XIH6_9AGAM|nr:hypothetical protein SISNIDRAFT_451674 [Sistotremastrum niveocremeum HHB9708]KZT37380.1 hypothetical protein SISSUDRAFT_1048469 [Sistotremastrum suecicum HHB10207 ss-3]